MSNALDRICDDKRAHIARRKARLPMSQLLVAAERATAPRRFTATLATAAADGYGLIAEIKRASPSKGLIRADFDPATIARGYASGGATCLSVLTDGPYFQGADEHLTAARAAVELPVLRKDFMLDPYQVIEARSLGADCILLIMAVLEDGLARELEDVARSQDMDVLIEVHDEDELDRALRLHSPLIGVNNRNLKTLETDTETTRRLARRIPSDRLLICESGLNTPDDLARMAAVGARCFLIGEALMREADVAQAVRAMLSSPAPESEAARREARP